MSEPEAPKTAAAETSAATETETPAPAPAVAAEAPAVEAEDDAPRGEQWALAGMPVLDDGDSAVGTILSSTASITESILEYRTLHGRTYHSDRKTGENVYWGPNDERQNEGADIMHHCMTLSLHGALHQAPLGENFAGKVLDVGTGTGIWAIDFADEYPGAHVVGTDLSPIQPSFLPVNCEFQIDDASQEWTFKEDSLDYVHMRWLVGSFTDWNGLLKQAYRCLKPGGWIEWYDFDAVVESDDDTLPKEAAWAQWTGIWEGAVKKLGLPISFRICHDDTMPNAVKGAGFINYNQNKFKIPIGGWPSDPHQKEVGMYLHATIDQDAEGYLNSMATALGWRPNEIQVFAAYLKKELREKKIHSHFVAMNVWAQKPLSA